MKALIAVSAVLLALSLIGLSPATAGTFRTVALDGAQAPGVGAGSTWFHYSSNGAGFVNLNDSGHTAFAGNLIPNFGRTSRGIWSEGGGSGLELLARGGFPAPGTQSGYVFEQFQTPIINAAGQTAFTAFLFVPGADLGDRTGIWSEGRGAGLELVARSNDPAPGTGAGVVFSPAGIPFSRFPRLNDAGQVAFYGILGGLGVDASNDTGIWSEGAGTGVGLVARAGDGAPGTGSGVVFSDFLEPVLNGAGETAFFATLAGAGVTSSDDSGIWSEGGGAGLSLVAREGDQAPGTTAEFSNFNNSPGFNDAGESVFQAFLRGTGITSSNDTGVWSEGGGGGLALVAREGDPAPGAGPGVVFGGSAGLGFAAVINAAGRSAFRGFVDGPGVDATNRFGIWSEGRGTGLQLVARSGEPPPGVTDGSVFLSFFDLHLNGSGQAAFKASAGIAGITFTEGIWAEDSTFCLRQVARSGDSFDVDDGPGTDLRTISRLSLLFATGNEDGRNTAHNDSGQVAFSATFTDRTAGFFVYTPDSSQPCAMADRDPIVTIVSPLDAEVFDTDDVVVYGTASDDSMIASVAVNGVAATLVSTGNPSDPVEVQFSALVPIALGANAIAAVALDDTGNTAVDNVSVDRIARICDTNGDQFIDLSDVSAIFAARGSLASGPADPRDSNADGVISINDGRLCALACDLPDCAVQPVVQAAPGGGHVACGLLGIEPLLVLGVLGVDRRLRRRTER